MQGLERYKPELSLTISGGPQNPELILTISGGPQNPDFIKIHPVVSEIKHAYIQTDDFPIMCTFFNLSSLCHTQQGTSKKTILKLTNYGSRTESLQWNKMQ
jgi:hypothetical protein